MTARGKTLGIFKSQGCDHRADSAESADGKERNRSDEPRSRFRARTAMLRRHEGAAPLRAAPS